MSALWKEPWQTISGVIKAMGGHSKWKYNTYVTYIKRMCEKGLIGYEQFGRDKFYYPLVDQKECIIEESKNILQKISGKASKDFLVCMIKESSLSTQDCEELKELLDNLSKKGD